MKRIFLVVFMLTVSIGVSAQYRVAMMKPFIDGEDVGSFERNLLYDSLEKALGNSGQYRVVSRGPAVDALLKDFDFESSGLLTNSEKAVIAGMQNVDYICMSSVSSKNGRYLIRAKFIDKATGEYSSIVSCLITDWNDLPEKCAELASELSTGHGSVNLLDML